MWGHIFESFVFAEVLKSYYNDGIVMPPLYYYRDHDRNEIDLVIADGDFLHPVEIKASGDPTRAMIRAFRLLEKLPEKKVGAGAVLCMVKERLPLAEDVWALPVQLL